jgi:hypothetical protein
MLTLENVRTHAQTYVGQQTRRAQDAVWMYEFLRESLSDAAKMRIALQLELCQVNDTPDGPCYLKTILLTFFVETNATDFHLREKLHNLPAKMKELTSDVSLFNQYVRETVSDLASGGGASDDLLVYVFNAYKVVEDHAFKRWITRKREDYDDGRQAITVQALMTTAETKFNQLTQEQTWKAKTPKEIQLITLTAQLKEAKDTLAKISTGKGNKDNKPNAKKSNSNESSDSENSKRKAEFNKNRPEYPAWRREQHGKDTKLVKDGKTYW